VDVWEVDLGLAEVRFLEVGDIHFIQLSWNFGAMNSGICSSKCENKVT
jgi:hypothetical protein